jgi:hypothetical protein
MPDDDRLKNYVPVYAWFFVSLLLVVVIILNASRIKNLQQRVGQFEEEVKTLKGGE